MSTVASFKQACPSCGGSITIKNPALIGKKVDCPKCKYRFVVEENAAGSPAAETNGKAVPQAAAKAKIKSDKGAKTKPKAAPAPKSKKGMLIFGGVGVGVLLVVGLIMMFAGGAAIHPSPDPKAAIRPAVRSPTTRKRTSRASGPSSSTRSTKGTRKPPRSFATSSRQ